MPASLPAVLKLSDGSSIHIRKVWVDDKVRMSKHAIEVSVTHPLEKDPAQHPFLCAYFDLKDDVLAMTFAKTRAEHFERTGYYTNKDIEKTAPMYREVFCK